MMNLILEVNLPVAASQHKRTDWTSHGSLALPKIHGCMDAKELDGFLQKVNSHFLWAMVLHFPLQAQGESSPDLSK